MITLKPEYRNLMDAKLRAETIADALHQLEAVFGWHQDWAIIEAPGLRNLDEENAALWEWERSLWANAYIRGDERRLPKDELHAALLQVITTA